MADDSSVPPLSRRVPGATNRPKPKMRIAPPALPEELVGRLRPKQAATAETTATPARRISGEAPAKPERQVAPAEEARADEARADEARADEAQADEAPPEAPASWYVVPDSPASPVADSNETTQPIPVIAAASEAQGPVKVMVDVRKEQLPRRGGGPRSAGPPRPGGRSRSARSQPAITAQPADSTKPVGKAQPAGRTQPAGRPGTPVRQRPAAQRALPGKSVKKPAAVVAPSPGKLVPGQSRIASFWRRWAASRSRPQQQGELLLRPLFRESLSIEEMVASVRAQAAGRRADQGRRYRISAAVLLVVVVVAVALVVVVVI